MATRYNVRNVAQKEIYDSYMGILRISPIAVNGKDHDDPTSILNTLVDVLGEIDKDGEANPNSPVYVRLSDSDGNDLPISFHPKAFTTEVRIVENGTDSRKSKDIINLSTKVKRNIYVSNSLTVRSTVLLEFQDDEWKEKKYPLITIGAKGSASSLEGRVITKSILCYPIEAPNDEDYFNNKNTLPTAVSYVIGGSDDTMTYRLFNPEDTTPRHEQVKTNLLRQPKSWFDKTFPIDSNDESKHRVKVDGRFINTFNNKGEEIPILHTRDYVLGHYDGHSWSEASQYGDLMKEKWIEPNNKLQEVRDYDFITKLSWIRFDDLIWDALDEILKGNVRHTKGRYDNLGSSEEKQVNIKPILFGQGESNGQYISQKSIKYGYLDETAPLLGAGVQPGLITYSAVPFNRYWFHRCRQVCQNLYRRNTLLDKDPDTNWQKDVDKDSSLFDEASLLFDYYSKDLITPCTMATLTPMHSLSKDYLLCNGCPVSFENFPNINPTNENLFVTKNGMPVGIDQTTQTYKFRKSHNNNILEGEPNDYNHDNVYKALQNTNIQSFVLPERESECIHLPNLFSLTERYPRFIRGLDWQVVGENEITTQSSVKPVADYDKINVSNNKNVLYYYHENWVQQDEHGIKSLPNPPKDIWGNNGAVTGSDISEVKLHFFNYDHLTETEYHKHKLFSSNQGTSGNNIDLSYTYYYDYDANDGGTRYKRWAETASINRNFLFNDIKYPNVWKKTHSNHWVNTKSREWLDYCFKDRSVQFFYNFTPIPNCGLFLFNGDIYNNYIEDKPMIGNIRGTVEQLENNKWRGYTYYDMRNEPHTFTSADINNDGSPEDWTPIEQGETSEQLDARYEFLKKHAEAKERRRNLLMKLNESEARIPISYIGKAQFSTRYVFTYERKRSWLSSVFKGDSWDTETEVFSISNVGGYVIKGFKDKGGLEGKFRCLTSLAYTTPENLARGHVQQEYDPEKPDTYWNTHNVTDFYKSSKFIDKSSTTTYGNNDTSGQPVSLKLDVQSPYPSHIKLLPLIRL